MSVPSKSKQTGITLQNVAANGFVIGSGIDVSTEIAARVRWRVGRDSTTVFVNPPIFRVEASFDVPGSTKPGEWVQIRTQSIGVGANLASQTASGQSGATLNISSTSNFNKGDRVFMKNPTLSLSEWGIIASIVANTSITLEETPTNSQSSSIITNGALVMDSGPLDLTTFKGLRLCVEGEANAAIDFNVDAVIGFFDSFG